MYSFKDINEKKVIIPDDANVTVDDIKDIETKEITDYIVIIDERPYSVTEGVYKAVIKEYNL